MIVEVIRLIRPGLFLPCFKILPPQKDKILVRPKYLSICAADQRYFNGNRPPEVLAKKLPMSLIHEAVGTVVTDPTGTYEPDQHLILLPGGLEHGDSRSNYQKNAFFRSSNADGFCQELLYMHPDEVIPVPRETAKYYVFAEMVSVCCHAIRRVNELGLLQNAQRIGIWGDGSMGYLMALTVQSLLPSAQIVLFGKHDEKLMLFSFVYQKVNILDTRLFPDIDIAFECVGGDGATQAIDQIINTLCPCGTAVLMGVSEIPPSMNTRLVLEKGLFVLGSSRSQKCDFEKAKNIIDKEYFVSSLKKIISEKFIIKSDTDLRESFVFDRTSLFKTLLELSY